MAADEERCRALLSVLCRRYVTPAELVPIDAAAAYWVRGDQALANLRLVFSGLPRLSEPADAYRLQAAEYLLDRGMSPNELMMELGLDAHEVALGKYDPNQPRVSAGNGRDSGRWTDTSVETYLPRTESPTNIVLAANQTTPGGVIYGDKIQRQMKSRDFTPEQVDEAVKTGTRIDAINKATCAPAIRYVNPTTGQSVVIDTTTNEVIQVARPDFKFGPGGGDMPGAVMRPPPLVAPAPPSAAAPIVEEPVIIPDIILPP